MGLRVGEATVAAFAVAKTNKNQLSAGERWNTRVG